MGNELSHNTYIRTDACSARNITWQYIHNFGQVPKSYTTCPSYAAILTAHCCSDGICTPNELLDKEWARYEWPQYYKDKKRQMVALPWDGLGNPYRGRAWPTDLPEELDDAFRDRIRKLDREHNATQYLWNCNAFFHGGSSDAVDFPVDIKDSQRGEKDEWEVCETEGEMKGMCRMASFWDHSEYYPKDKPWWVDVEVQHSMAETVTRDLDGLTVGAIAGVELTG